MAAILPRIFVHIPSYRDRECQWTIKDLFDKARLPERVFVGICWQTLPEEDQDCFQEETRADQVRSLHFHISEARGVCWAREHARTLWQGEEYSLQIDSHMRFVPGWDEKMLAMLAACDSPDPVLTHYPPGYTPPNQLNEQERPRVQCVKEFLPIGIPQFSARPVPSGIEVTRPLPTAACAGGFIFGSSRILRDVPFDAEVYFLGEEPSLAVRLWTHGFDLFSPHETVIYHYYTRAEGFRHWNDSKGWRKLDKRSLQRVKALLEPASCLPEEVAKLGIHGLGTRRSLAEYEAFGGVSFAGKTLASYARTYPFVLGVSQNDASASDSDLTPVSGLRLFIVDDEGLLFSESKGEFYRLNTSATFVWCQLEEGVAWREMAAKLADWREIALPQAERELASLAAHWLGQGVLRRTGDEPPAVTTKVAEQRPESGPAPRLDPAHFDFRVRRYRLLEVNFDVRYGDRELEQWVHPALAHLEAAAVDAPVHTVTVVRILRYYYVFCDNDPIHFGEAVAELSAHVSCTLQDRAVQQHNHILRLHAAGVAKDGRFILLPGKAGSGKTSLAARLIAAGCEYFSDEVVLLERGTDQVRPVPLSLRVNESGLSLLAPHFPNLHELPVHQHRDKIAVRYLPPPPRSLPTGGRSVHSGLLVFPCHSEDAPTVVRELSAAEAFGRLLDECVAIPKALSLADAEALVRTVASMRCYALTSGDLDSAAEAILNMDR